MVDGGKCTIYGCLRVGGTEMSSLSVASSERFAIGRAFLDTFGILGRNIGPILGLVALLGGLPMLIFEYFVPGAVLKDRAIVPELSQSSGMIISLLYPLIVFASMTILVAAVSRVTIDDLQGKKPSFDGALSEGIKHVLPVAGIAIPTYLSIFGAFVVAIVAEMIAFNGFFVGYILGIALWAMLTLRWFLAIPIQVQEKHGVVGSMKRSALLSKGSRWALLGLLLIVAVAAFILSIVVIFLVAFLPDRGVAFGAGIISAIYPAMLAIAATVGYLRLHAMKEGSRV